MPEPAKFPCLLTPKAAALALAISPRKLWQITNTKELRSVRIGRAVRYRSESIQAYLESLETKSRTDH